jgi:hypothetical protein
MLGRKRSRGCEFAGLHTMKRALRAREAMTQGLAQRSSWVDRANVASAMKQAGL